MDVGGSNKEEIKRKMGSSILQHCLRRTKSETNKEHKLKKIEKRHKKNQSADAISLDHERNSDFQNLLNDANERTRKCLCPSLGEQSRSIQRQKCSKYVNSNIAEFKNKNQKNDGSKLLDNLSLKLENDQLDISDVNSTPGTSCFPKLSCCRRARRKSTENVRDSTRIVYEDYSKLPQTSSICSSDYTDSIMTASSCLSSLLSENSESNFSQDFSLNLSHDSGFDDSPCFLNIIYDDHKCKNIEVCLKKHYNLNLHLKNLMSCMPKSHSDCEAIQHEISCFSGSQRNPKLYRRRNAICETSVEMRTKFCKALCSFLTLQAMAKYDFL